MSAMEKDHWSPEDYLAFERSSDQKHEYLAGSIYAMAGVSRNHNLIASQVNGIFYMQLRQRPCEHYQGDMRLKVTATGLYTYPDVLVVCDTPIFDDKHKDTLLNPTVLVEVLSPSTENYDRGKKFQHYRALPSLQDYLLIAQDSTHVEHYTRQPDEHWLLADFTDLQATIHLTSINCTLLLADIYEKVVFEA